MASLFRRRCLSEDSLSFFGRRFSSCAFSRCFLSAQSPPCFSGLAYDLPHSPLLVLPISFAAPVTFTLPLECVLTCARLILCFLFFLEGIALPCISRPALRSFQKPFVGYTQFFFPKDLLRSVKRLRGPFLLFTP